MEGLLTGKLHFATILAEKNHVAFSVEDLTAPADMNALAKVERQSASNHDPEITKSVDTSRNHSTPNLTTNLTSRNFDSLIQCSDDRDKAPKLHASLYIDYYKIEQVVRNLITNAVLQRNHSPCERQIFNIVYFAFDSSSSRPRTDL